MGRHESVLLEAIHLFKYHGRFAVGEALGDMMAKFRYEEFTIESDMLVMPVPLHNRRLRERGFNQSLVLSRRIARAHRLDIDFECLQRKWVRNRRSVLIARPGRTIFQEFSGWFGRKTSRADEFSLWTMYILRAVRLENAQKVLSGKALLS
ncbi:MAG: hypothetical protein ABSB79_16610 [Syntrophales bacterium]|jgi:hypothetical protein